ILTFHAAELDALNKVALGKEEEGNDRQNRNDGCRHQQVKGVGVLALKEAEAEGHGKVLDTAQVDIRLKERIPCPPEGKNRHRRQRRAAEWQHNRPYNLQRVGSVNPGRVFQFQWNARKELPHQENQESVAEKGTHKQ